MKDEVRIIAWDDCAFSFSDKRVRLVGPIFRGGKFMDGLLSTEIAKDGLDVTDKICSVLLESRSYDQLSLVMLDGISFGGLNIVDIKAIKKNTGLPVIAVTRKKPNIKNFLTVLKKLDRYEDRVRAVTNAGNIYTYGDIFYQKEGLTLRECEEVLAKTCTQSNIPEPLRAAHIIASGLSNEKGESRGQA
jgi:endonuclease V-like protein UPF0215 family